VTPIFFCFHRRLLLLVYVRGSKRRTTDYRLRKSGSIASGEQTLQDDLRGGAFLHFPDMALCARGTTATGTKDFVMAECINDRLHYVLQPVNNAMHQANFWRVLLTGIGQFIIDSWFLFLMAFW
jgi:hypothetical protein